MDEFSGSYILTLAGYNAGPGRARQWIREFGDPRDPKVDPIDWIERIPIQETREYVARCWPTSRSTARGLARSKRRSGSKTISIARASRGERRRSLNRARPHRLSPSTTGEARRVSGGMRQSSSRQRGSCDDGRIGAFREFYFTARDGLRLHGRHYPARSRQNGAGAPCSASPGSRAMAATFIIWPLPCLKIRNGARCLHARLPRPRPVAIRPGLAQLCHPDRDAGRARFHDPGRSAWAGDHRHLARRPDRDGDGGSAARAVGPVVLNDIGPVIEQKGLGRISAYVGRIPLPGNWAEAAKLVQDISGKSFPGVAAGRVDRGRAPVVQRAQGQARAGL